MISYSSIMIAKVLRLNSPTSFFLLWEFVPAVPKHDYSNQEGFVI